MVAPEYSLFATGYRNRFGHPKDDVLERYRGAGSRIYRTDLDGAISVGIGSDGNIEMRRHRASVRRYWHAPLENPDLPDDEENYVNRDARVTFTAYVPPGSTTTTTTYVTPVVPAPSTTYVAPSGTYYVAPGSTTTIYTTR